MLISEFIEFVDQSDQFSDYSRKKRRDIAIEGLMSEIGSVVSAIKKEQLREGGALGSRLAKVELREELGDVLWYVFAVSRFDKTRTKENVLISDIRGLQKEIGKGDRRAQSIHKVLSPQRAKEFLTAAELFPTKKNLTFRDYQRLGWMTARTKGSTLLTVCETVLAQLGAQLMRHMLPEVELKLNRQLKHRPIRIILAEICWHVAAIATLYHMNLNAIVSENKRKNLFRIGDDAPTPLHDGGRPKNEQFPRHFEIIIKSASKSTSQMWWNGRKFGDPLKDNSYEPDGYRFHDVLHLANAVHLGWSPVIRKLMKLKRKTDETLDNIEDGGRAAVVEEAIVKIIHVEAARRAQSRQPKVRPEVRRLFAPGEDIPFSLLKLVQRLAEGHEVYKNKAWEWENAIRDGYDIFQKLRRYKNGRVVCDLERRTIKFRRLKSKIKSREAR